MPGFPCCCKKGVFDWYFSNYGPSRGTSINYVVLTPSRFPAGTTPTADFASTYKSTDEGYSVPLHVGSSDDASKWEHNIADTNDRLFGLRNGPNAQSPMAEFQNPDGINSLTVSEGPDANYTGLLKATVSPSSDVYVENAVTISAFFQEYTIEICAEHVDHRWLIVDLIGMDASPGVVHSSWWIDLETHASNGLPVVDYRDGRFGYRFSYTAPTPAAYGGTIRVYMTDGSATHDFTGTTSEAVRLYRPVVWPTVPGEVGNTIDVPIVDMVDVAAVRTVHYLNDRLDHHFTDQYWRFVESTTGDRDLIITDYQYLVYGFSYSTDVVYPTSTAPHADMLINPGTGNYGCSGWSAGAGKMAYLNFIPSTDGAGDVTGSGIYQLSAIYEFGATERNTYVGRTGTGVYTYSIDDRDEEDILPQPYHVPQHGYPNVFGIKMARLIESEVDETKTSGDTSPATHTAKLTFGPWTEEKVCMQIGGEKQTCTVDGSGNLDDTLEPSSTNGYIAKFLTPGKETFFERSVTVDHPWEYGTGSNAGGGGAAGYRLHATPTVWVGALELEAAEDYPAGICFAMSLDMAWNGSYDHTWTNEVAVVIDGVEVFTKEVYRLSQLIGDEIEVHGIQPLPGGRCVWFQRNWQRAPRSAAQLEPGEPPENVFGVPDPDRPWIMHVYEGTTLSWSLLGGKNDDTGETNSSSGAWPECRHGGHEWFYVAFFWLCDDRLNTDWHTNWVFSVAGNETDDGPAVRFPQSIQVDDVDDGPFTVFHGTESSPTTDNVKKPSKIRVGLRANTWDTSECDP